MSTRNLLLLLLGLLVILFAAIRVNDAIDARTIRILEQNGNTGCDSDGRLCPDGSIVGRIPPACEFAACPGVTSNPDNTGGRTTGILNGTVTISPTCPVERVPADPNCAPRAYITNVSALMPGSMTVVASTKTTSGGTYVLDLPAGQYILRAESGSVFPSCGEQSVTILANVTHTVHISCDSGIR